MLCRLKLRMSVMKQLGDGAFAAGSGGRSNACAVIVEDSSRFVSPQPIRQSQVSAVVVKFMPLSKCFNSCM